eukprot:m.310951 g.310951  ORF g.310951 m.310951 type:complete len:406 (+) comp56955_c0_seq1:123-1340(+)
MLLFAVVAVTVTAVAVHASTACDPFPVNLEKAVALSEVIVRGRVVDFVRRYHAGMNWKIPVTKVRIRCALKVNSSHRMRKLVQGHNHIFVRGLNDRSLCTFSARVGDSATFLLHSCDPKERVCDMVYQGLQREGDVRKHLQLGRHECLTNLRQRPSLFTPHQSGTRSTPTTTQPETPTSVGRNNSVCGHTIDPAKWHASIKVGGRIRCDGTLVRPQWVLTAIECVAATADTGSNQITVIFGGTSDDVRYHPVKSIRTLPGKYGYALLEIDGNGGEPVCLTAMKLPTELTMTVATATAPECLVTRTTPTGLRQTSVIPSPSCNSSCLKARLKKRLLRVVTNSLDVNENIGITGSPLMCRLPAKGGKWYQVGMAVGDRYLARGCGKQVYYERTLDVVVRTVLGENSA